MPARTIPSAVGEAGRSSCPDYDYYRRAYTSERVSEPAEQNWVPGVAARGALASAGRPTHPGFFEYGSVLGQGSCDIDAGLFRLVATKRGCTAGLTLEHSATTCAGQTGDACDYYCFQGYEKEGAHVCTATGAFVGGRCVPSSA